MCSACQNRCSRSTETRTELLTPDKISELLQRRTVDLTRRSNRSIGLSESPVVAAESNKGAQPPRPIDARRIDHARWLPDRTVGDTTVALAPRDVKSRFLAEKEQERRRMPRPGVLVRKYPDADREWAWQWIFPASRDCVDQNSGRWVQFHLHESVCRTHVLNRGSLEEQSPAARRAGPR